jgi:hypothetical protein
VALGACQSLDHGGATGAPIPQTPTARGLRAHISNCLLSRVPALGRENTPEWAGAGATWQLPVTGTVQCCQCQCSRQMQAKPCDKRPPQQLEDPTATQDVENRWIVMVGWGGVLWSKRKLFVQIEPTAEEQAVEQQRHRETNCARRNSQLKRCRKTLRWKKKGSAAVYSTSLPPMRRPGVDKRRMMSAPQATRRRVDGASLRSLPHRPQLWPLAHPAGQVCPHPSHPLCRHLPGKCPQPS